MHQKKIGNLDQKDVSRYFQKNSGSFYLQTHRERNNARVSSNPVGNHGDKNFTMWKFLYDYVSGKNQYVRFCNLIEQEKMPEQQEYSRDPGSYRTALGTPKSSSLSLSKHQSFKSSSNRVSPVSTRKKFTLPEARSPVVQTISFNSIRDQLNDLVESEELISRQYTKY